MTAKRNEHLVKAAVKMLKTAKEDKSEVQKAAARKLYKASGG
jgi:hypothetical protein